MVEVINSINESKSGWTPPPGRPSGWLRQLVEILAANPIVAQLAQGSQRSAPRAAYDWALAMAESQASRDSAGNRSTAVARRELASLQLLAEQGFVDSRRLSR